MAEHIDRNRLHSDLRYHFDYISKFLNFTKDDIHILNTLAPVLFPHIPHIVESVCSKLCSFDITKQSFAITHEETESFSSADDSMFTTLSQSTDNLKEILSVYLKRVLIQTEWNDVFLKYLSQMGELFGDKNCYQEIKIEYIHINVLHGYLEHVVVDTIWKQESFDLKRKHVAIRALNKLFWIQNNLFAMHYGMAPKETSTTKRRTRKH